MVCSISQYLFLCFGFHDVLIGRFCSFNCLLPAFTCGQYADCNTFNGQCTCPAGFGGVDCIEPRTSPDRHKPSCLLASYKC